MKYVSLYGSDRVRLLDFERNRGKGGAVRMVSRLNNLLITIGWAWQGCLSARGEKILFVDADGATRISDMNKLEQAIDKIAKDHVSVFN